MRRKMPRLSPPPPFGPPGVAAVVRAASLACQNAVKAQKFVPLQKSSEESRFKSEIISESFQRELFPKAESDERCRRLRRLK
jgi:hypothetical protein